MSPKLDYNPDQTFTPKEQRSLRGIRRSFSDTPLFIRDTMNWIYDRTLGKLGQLWAVRADQRARFRLARKSADLGLQERRAQAKIAATKITKSP